MKPISFMSESTAAYALVPNLITHLAKRFPCVIPMNFWLTREGSRVGWESMAAHTVRVVAGYARRPKVSHSEDDRILVKINSLLFTGARAGAEFGIPVIAGVPLANSLAGFFVGVPCSWYHLEPIEQEDSEFCISLSELSHTPCSQKGISGPLSPEEIMAIAESHCRELDWIDAVEGIRRIKEAERRYAGPFGGGYRPFFLVMPSFHGNAPTRQSSGSAIDRASR